MPSVPSELSLPWADEVSGPDISNLEIEDGEPVDNIYSEKQQRLLTEPLYSSWPGPPGPDGAHQPFLATANVGVFATAHDPPLVPDVLLSADVAAHPDLPREKRHRTYFIWEMGKPPDVVIEVVSNRKGGELGRRRRGYERMRVLYFVVWDPTLILGERELMAYVLGASGYVPLTSVSFPPLGGLALRPWEGSFERLTARWLRWYDGDVLIPTGAERADHERDRAEAERERADTERERAERFAALLARHGITDDEAER